MRELAVTMREFCIIQRLGEATGYWKETRRMMDGWIQARQPLGLWEYHGSRFWAHEWGDWKRPTWIYQKTNYTRPTWLPSVVKLLDFGWKDCGVHWLSLEKKRFRGNLIADGQYLQSCQKNGAREVLQRCVAGNGDRLKHGNLQLLLRKKVFYDEDKHWDVLASEVVKSSSSVFQDLTGQGSEQSGLNSVLILLSAGG